MTKKMTDKELNELKKELSTNEANYFSHIQFPVTFVDTAIEGFKNDINAARRVRCHDDHKWGFEKGFDAAIQALKDNYVDKSKSDSLLLALRALNDEVAVIVATHCDVIAQDYGRKNLEHLEYRLKLARQALKEYEK